jgi:hypothetical protein
MALLWCEARCNLMMCEIGCIQTSEGAFGTTNAAKAAKRQGWKIVNGEWVCPRCHAASINETQ